MKNEYYLALVTLCNALIVAIIAIRQYQLSKERFKLDIFEKRYCVYKYTQSFLAKIFITTKIDEKDIIEFRGNTQDVVFFFDDAISDYLNVIDQKAILFGSKQDALEGIPVSEERSRINEEKHDLLMWLIEQIPLLKDKFSPYLAFKNWK